MVQTRIISQRDDRGALFTRLLRRQRARWPRLHAAYPLVEADAWMTEYHLELQP